MTTQFTYEAAAGPLFLPDISGYTSFLRSVQEAHKDDAFAGGVVPQHLRDGCALTQPDASRAELREVRDGIPHKSRTSSSSCSTSWRTVPASSTQSYSTVSIAPVRR